MNKVHEVVESFGATRLVAFVFFLFIAICVPILHLDTATLYSQALVRIGMNGVLVLSMVPIMVCGAGMNFALPIGIVCGLLGGLLSLNMGLTGFLGFIVSIMISIPFAIVMGYLYGRLMNRVKGSEMIIATYVGFAVISLMCIVWLIIPLKNLLLRMQMGLGVRKDVVLSDYWAGILDNFAQIKVGRFIIPTGLYMFFGIMCLCVFLFMNSKIGVMMKIAGQNPKLAETNGINVDKMRIIGISISTVIGAIGILVYAQSFGFIQFYDAPKMMSFSAVAAVLIGGATNKKASILNVIFGVFIFQGLLTLSMPVANTILPESNISDIMRTIISNGIILYALARAKEQR